jgi:hypothetical protein
MWRLPASTKMRWCLSSSASRLHLNDVRSTPTKTKQRESSPASNAVRLVTLLQIVSIMIVTRDKKRAGRRRKRRATGRQRARHTLERNGTQTAPLLTPTTKDSLPQPSTSLLSSPTNVHTCLMAKEKKVHVRDSPKYSTSIDEESSDDEVDYSSLFKGLDRAKVEKINELIDSLNEKIDC